MQHADEDDVGWQRATGLQESLGVGSREHIASLLQDIIYSHIQEASVRVLHIIVNARNKCHIFVCDLPLPCRQALDIMRRKVCNIQDRPAVLQLVWQWRVTLHHQETFGRAGITWSKFDKLHGSRTSASSLRREVESPLQILQFLSFELLPVALQDCTPVMITPHGTRKGSRKKPGALGSQAIPRRLVAPADLAQLTPSIVCQLEALTVRIY
mmetsp:Transcript_99527/g.187109  ORF Transcript_99527/g.187109 Transcript_99527/m.187109 type:complete len:212 (-) Transcript_99527:136-771(-)